MLGEWLDLMFPKGFSNLNDSMMVVEKDNYCPTSETLTVLAVSSTAHSSARTPWRALPT